MVRATIEYAIATPEYWDFPEVERRRNNGSWCADNMLDELSAISANGRCLCDFVRFECIGDATPGQTEMAGIDLGASEYGMEDR